MEVGPEAEVGLETEVGPEAEVAPEVEVTPDVLDLTRDTGSDTVGVEVDAVDGMEVAARLKLVLISPEKDCLFRWFVGSK